MIALASDEVFSSRVGAALDTARTAQAEWAERSVSERAQLIGCLRPILAEKADDLARAAAAVHGRPLAEKLVSEVLPLLEACRFLERYAAEILRTEKFGRRGRPLWLGGSTFEVQRKPFGVVLVVGPSNYPLFIPAVQTLHALAAGNAVAVKPAPGAGEPIALFLELLTAQPNFPADLVQLLPETVAAANEAVSCGIDQAIFTGSSNNGREFLRQLARENVPGIMELSGADAVFVRNDADVQLAAKAIAFGLRLNAGNTCMVPHAIIVHQAVEQELATALRSLGAATESIFAVDNDEQALQYAQLDDHGLGASIFSRDEEAARQFARRLPTGFVTINDLIVPTADPRFPFGGVRASGFGVTRGAEGLRTLTYPHVVALRRSRFLPHLEPAEASDDRLFSAFITLLHGRGFSVRLHALKTVWRAIRARKKS